MALFITACPTNTYKASVSSCQQCPPNSHTDGTGHEIEGCICNTGFNKNGDKCEGGE